MQLYTINDNHISNNNNNNFNEDEDAKGAARVVRARGGDGVDLAL